jgi:hypothetical protein
MRTTGFRYNTVTFGRIIYLDFRNEHERVALFASIGIHHALFAEWSKNQRICRFCDLSIAILTADI